MSQPKIVVFDLGKVLLDFDYRVASQGLARNSTATLDEIQAFIDQSPLLMRYEKGQVSREEFFDEVRKMSGYSGTLDQFVDLFSDVFAPIVPMIKLHESLRLKGVPTYIFSNTNDIAIDHIRRHYPFFNHFDGYVLSYERGFMKPEQELYEAVERLSGCRGATILYVDDLPENVTAGIARGWTGLVHTSTDSTAEFIHRSGLLT